MLRIFMVVYNELSTLFPDSYAAKNKKNEIYRDNERYSLRILFVCSPYFSRRKAFMIW